MDYSLNNVGFWVPLGIWALVVFTLAALAANLFRQPRHRAVLLLCAMGMSLLPFLADRMPGVRLYSYTYTTPYSSVYMTLPTTLHAVPPVSPAAVITFDWLQMVVRFWLTGSLIAFVWLAFSIFQMNRLARRGVADAPMVAGFPKAKILLPENWPGELSPEEAEAALAHEQVHLRRFHVQGRVLVELFRCLFWWAPTVHLAARQYSQALEELADAEAIQTVKPESLASALVKVAAAGHLPRLAAGATSNGKHLQVRLTKIMENRKPGQWPSAILVVAASVGVAYAAAPRVSQASDTANFGLAKGATWTYDYTYGKDHTPNTQTVSKITPDGDATVFELVSKYDKYTSYTYAGLKKDGFVFIGLRGMAGPGYDLRLQTPKMLKPYKVGGTWKWFEAWRGQTMSGPNGEVPDTTKWDRNCVAKVAGMESVKVRAGTYQCFKVKVSITTRAEGTITHTEYISPEVGVVKQVEPAHGKTPEHTAELVKYSIAGP